MKAKPLIDQNISRRVLKAIENVFPGSRHVSEIRLDRATDGEIWEYAKREAMIILSKDGDLHQMALLHGPPPKVIWLSIGNCTTELITLIVAREAHHIESFANDAEAALLVIENPSAQT